MEAVTTVPYTGVKPTVSVAYLQTDGTLLVQGVMSQIDFQPTAVVVNHAFEASGYVKLVQ